MELTISATAEKFADQSFLFVVTGDPIAEGVDFAPLQVVLTKDKPSVTIKGLPAGTYTVTEKDGWSWRQTALDAQAAAWDNENKKMLVTEIPFDFGSAEKIYWLNGYHYGIWKDEKTKGGGKR